MFQQGLLLLFVEGLNFVQIQQHPVGSHEGIQLRHDLLDVCRGSGGGVELVEGAVGLLGDDIGNGGLSRAAGAVEHHIGDIPRIDQAAQHRALAQNMLLTVDLVQCLRPQKIGEWLIHMDALSCAYFLHYIISPAKLHYLFFEILFKKVPSFQRGLSCQNVATSGSAGWAFFVTSSAVRTGPSSPLYRGCFSAVIFAVTMTQERGSSVPA